MKPGDSCRRAAIASGPSTGRWLWQTLGAKRLVDTDPQKICPKFGHVPPPQESASPGKPWQGSTSQVIIPEWTQGSSFMISLASSSGTMRMATPQMVSAYRPTRAALVVLSLSAVQGITGPIARKRYRMSAVWPDAKIVAKLVRCCGRGISLAFLALAILAISHPAVSQLNSDRSLAATSKSIEATAILNQSIFPTRIVGNHSQPGWWRRPFS